MAILNLGYRQGLWSRQKEVSALPQVTVGCHTTCRIRKECRATTCTADGKQTTHTLCSSDTCAEDVVSCVRVERLHGRWLTCSTGCRNVSERSCSPSASLSQLHRKTVRSDD